MRQQRVNIILGFQEQLEKAEIFISWISETVMKYIWREENESIFSHILKLGDFKGPIVHKMILKCVLMISSLVVHTWSSLSVKNNK